MAWLEDMSRCEYFGSESAAFLIAIGWLQQGKPFVVEGRDVQVYAKLRALCENPWQPVVAAGYHDCDLCRFDAEARGTNNVFIPGNGCIYVCPELIVHYMNAHGYGPPKAFCDAVMACPAMRSMDYHKALLASGGRSLLK